MDLKSDLSGRHTPTPQWRQTRLRFFLGVIAVVAAFPSGAAHARNSVCSRWCVVNFPPGPARGRCVSEAAHGAGPCFACGPQGDDAGLCGGICCPAGETCSAAASVCVPTPMECGVVSGDPSAGTAMCAGPCPLDFPFCEFVPGTAGGRCTCVDHRCGGPGNPGLACKEDFCPGQGQICTTLADGGSCGCGPPPPPSILVPQCLCMCPGCGQPDCAFSSSFPPVCASDCPRSVEAECNQFCASFVEECGSVPQQVKWQCITTGRSCM